VIVHPTPLKFGILSKAIFGSTVVGVTQEFMGGSEATSRCTMTTREGDTTSPSKKLKDLYMDHIFYISNILLFHK